MSRKSVSNKKTLLPDIKFKSILITKFINLVMLNGKKTIAERIVYSALDMLFKYTNKYSIEVFEESINNVRPIVEIKPRRVGGSTYQIPVEVKINRSNTLAMRWIILYSKKRSEKSMELKLSSELFDALNNKGSSIKKKDEIHRIANANKAFAHYRW